MGYRSDAGLALTRVGIEKMMAALSGVSRETRNEVENLFRHAIKHAIEPDDGAEAWDWENLKWYTDDPHYYPDIDFIEELIAELDAEDFRLIRVGEDYDDTEVRGDFWENPFDLEIARAITMSV